METRLQEALWQDEKILWSGRPKPFALMEKQLKPGIILTWIVSALVLCLVLFMLIPKLSASNRALSDIIVLSVVVLFLPVLLSLRPYLDKRCLENQTYYAITNFRILALVRENTMYLPLGKGLKVALDNHEDGCGSLSFGDMVGTSPQKSRANAVLGLRSEESKNDMTGLIFYHVDQPEQLMRYFA